MNKKYYLLLKNTFITLIPLIVAITLLSGLIYGSAQQVYRQSANDPQIQITQDLSPQLAGGADPSFFMPQVKTDISKSLAAYIIIFDKDGKLVGSSATVADKDPEIPQGVFKDAKEKKELRFTWEAKSGDRSAVVIRYYSGKSTGFILAGRSLKEIEEREEMLTKTVFIGWIVTLIASFAALIFSRMILKSKE